ncbi:hypothetical protein PHEL85_3294 [Polaribacter sp. Hel1_85]|nr:hypothetical protein PHEL85_3294 [Polaribacter sp. Hel1_85]
MLFLFQYKYVPLTTPLSGDLTHSIPNGSWQLYRKRGFEHI